MSERLGGSVGEDSAFAGRRPSTRAEDGLTLLKAGRAEEALALLDQIESPDADALLWRGHALRMLGRYEDALQAFSRASQKAPQSGVPYAESAKICDSQGDAATAMTLAARANQLSGESEGMDLIIGTSLYEQGRPLDALNVAAHMLERWPSSAAAHNLRGGVLRSIGRVAEAVDAFDRALALEPTYGAAAYNRYALKAPASDDLVLARLREAALSDSLGDDDRRALIEFALGRAEEVLGNFDVAFAHFKRGAALMRQHVEYDEADALGQFEAVREVFTKDLVQQRSGSGAPAKRHVFVLGMPRSGTTLVEQILSSHPGVVSAGETSDLAASLVIVANERGLRFPEFVTNLGSSEWERLGYLYSSRLTSRYGDAASIVDKMPGNYLMLGAIHLALPNAKIIHCRRDPVDTCVSMFTHVFSLAHSYTYDLAELGRYYRAYQSLMDHWRSVLPSSAFLDVDYEALVADPATWSKLIVAHCDLDWDERCLAFHLSERQVRTASAGDVRRPVYTTAVGSAQRYSKHLEPLRQALSSPV
jgi:tetratricopeptide (TPR) repeat protein